MGIVGGSMSIDDSSIYGTMSITCRTMSNGLMVVET